MHEICRRVELSFLHEKLSDCLFWVKCGSGRDFHKCEEPQESDVDPPRGSLPLTLDRGGGGGGCSRVHCVFGIVVEIEAHCVRDKRT